MAKRMLEKPCALSALVCSVYRGFKLFYFQLGGGELNQVMWNSIHYNKDESSMGVVNVCN